MWRRPVQALLVLLGLWCASIGLVGGIMTLRPSLVVLGGAWIAAGFASAWWRLLTLRLRRRVTHRATDAQGPESRPLGIGVVVASVVLLGSGIAAALALPLLPSLPLPGLALVRGLVGAMTAAGVLGGVVAVTIASHPPEDAPAKAIREVSPEQGIPRADPARSVQTADRWLGLVPPAITLASGLGSAATSLGLPRTAFVTGVILCAVIAVIGIGGFLAVSATNARAGLAAHPRIRGFVVWAAVPPLVGGLAAVIVVTAGFFHLHPPHVPQSWNLPPSVVPSNGSGEQARSGGDPSEKVRVPNGAGPGVRTPGPNHSPSPGSTSRPTPTPTPIPPPPTMAPPPPTWSFPLRVPKAGTSRGPALAELNGVLYMVWKGSGSDTQIYWAAFDSATWSGQQEIPNTSTDHAPALAAFGGSLYLAWSNTADDGITYARFDGSQWSGPLSTGNAGTSSGPALTACNGTLYLAWKGSGTDPKVWWKASSDGASWSGQQSVPGASTSNQPAMASLNGSVYLAWSDTADDGITFTRYDGGGNQWETPQSVGNAGTSTGPTMTGFNGRLYMAWKGTGTDTNVYWASSDGARWTPQQNVPNVSTGHGPALAGLRSHLYLTSSDAASDDGISWTSQ